MKKILLYIFCFLFLHSWAQFLPISPTYTAGYGWLNRADWNTFNGKQSSLIFSTPLSNTSNTVSVSDASSSGSGVVNTTTQSFAGNKSFEGSLTFQSNVTYSTTTNGSLSGSNQRVPSHATTVIAFTNSGLTSIASANNGGVTAGHTFIIENQTGATITIVNNYTAAATNEAIYTGTGSNVLLPNQSSIWLIYDATGWYIMSGGLGVNYSPTVGSTSLTTAGTLTATSVYLNGTGGNGFISLPTQTTTPSSPSSGTVLFSNSNSKLSWRGSANTYMKTFDGGNNSADRVYSLPNRDVKIDSITSSTSTALSGIMKATGSLVTTVSTTGTNSVVCSTGATVTTATFTSSDFTSTTNTFPLSGTAPIISGQWSCPIVNGLTAATGWNGVIYFIPYIVSKTHTVTDIGIEVTTAVAASNINLALYNDDGTGTGPGSKIEESGNISSATTGFKTFTYSSTHALTAASQIYWLGVQSSAAGIGLRYSNAMITMVAPTTGSSAQVKTITQAFGSFPSSGSSAGWSSGANGLFVRQKFQ